MRGMFFRGVVVGSITSAGPAAAFQSPVSVPPFTVTSTKKVTNLNADLLDGINSSGFVQGKGQVYTLAVSIPRPPSGSNATDYTPSPAVAPGFANLEDTCPAIGDTSPDPPLGIWDLSGGTINFFYRNNANPSAVYNTDSNGDLTVFGAAAAGDITTLTIQGVPTSSGLQTVMTARSPASSAPPTADESSGPVSSHLTVRASHR